MSATYGIETPGPHVHAALRKPARYLVVIDSAGSVVARLFDQNREPVGEFDAGTEEVALMTRGLAPTIGALGGEWAAALGGHNHTERAAAEAYTLDV
jgi:hypothetical protein